MVGLRGATVNDPETGAQNERFMGIKLFPRLILRSVIDNMALRLVLRLA